MWVVRGCRRGSGSGRFGGKKVSGQRGHQVDLRLRESVGGLGLFCFFRGGSLSNSKERWNFDELVCVLPQFTNELLETKCFFIIINYLLSFLNYFFLYGGITITELCGIFVFLCRIPFYYY